MTRSTFWSNSFFRRFFGVSLFLASMVLFASYVVVFIGIRNDPSQIIWIYLIVSISLAGSFAALAHQPLRPLWRLGALLVSISPTYVLVGSESASLEFFYSYGYMRVEEGFLLVIFSAGLSISLHFLVSHNQGTSRKLFGAGLIFLAFGVTPFWVIYSTTRPTPLPLLVSLIEADVAIEELEAAIVGGANIDEPIPETSEFHPYPSPIFVHAGSTALHIAALKGEIQEVEVLLEAGADPNVHGWLGRTPMHYALFRPDENSAALMVIEALLEAGADAQEVNQTGKTPLHFAAMTSDDAEIFEVLLSAGADINSPDQASQTPLGLAIRFGSPEAVRILLDAGAIPYDLDQEGRSAFMLLVDRCREDGSEMGGDLLSDTLRKLSVLILARVDPRRSERDGRSPLDVAQDRCGENVLELAEEAVQQVQADEE